MLRMGYIRNNKAFQITLKGFLLCDLGEDRTLDPLIKSQLLYRLSYQVIIFYRGANKRFFY